MTQISSSLPSLRVILNPKQSASPATVPVRKPVTSRELAKFHPVLVARNMVTAHSAPSQERREQCQKEPKALAALLTATHTEA